MPKADARPQKIEVACFGHGKAHKPYEFAPRSALRLASNSLNYSYFTGGCKVSELGRKGGTSPIAVRILRLLNESLHLILSILRLKRQNSWAVFAFAILPAKVNADAALSFASSIAWS